MRTSFTIADLEEKHKKGLIRDYSLPPELKKGKKSKYGNKKVVAFGQPFDSKKEANRFYTLKMLEVAGEITELKTQVPFQLSVCKYVSDFTYYRNGKFIVEDVKSAFTRKLPVYRLKKKLMEAELGIIISEV